METTYHKGQEKEEEWGKKILNFPNGLTMFRISKEKFTIEEKLRGYKWILDEHIIQPPHNASKYHRYTPTSKVAPIRTGYLVKEDCYKVIPEELRRTSNSG